MRRLLLLALLPLAAATAQPVKNVDAKRWPNLAAAQASIADAYGRLGEAQKANNEVKLAATAANAKKGG